MVRDRLIPVRVSDHEYREIAAAARANSSRGISTYMRSECLYIVHNQASLITAAKQEKILQISWELARLTAQHTSSPIKGGDYDPDMALNEIRQNLEQIYRLSIQLESLASAQLENRPNP